MRQSHIKIGFVAAVALTTAAVTTIAQAVSEPIKLMREYARTSPAVRAQIGEFRGFRPTLLGGELSYVGNEGSADMSGVATGSTGSTVVHAIATKVAGGWTLDRIWVSGVLLKDVPK